MDKKKAMLMLYEKYDLIKNIVYKLDTQYFKLKGKFYEDITHDVFLKLQDEIDKLENQPHLILKFLDKYYNSQTYIIYNKAKQIFIDFLRREKKYVRFDKQKLNRREKENLIFYPENKSDNNIQKKVDAYIKTFYWFDQKLFDLYRYEFKLHKTEMSKKTKISYATIFRTVKRCKIKIKDKFKEDYYE
tara:strand:+ start:13106 stop:13669 length:564 start_codon:yes stop_codon:yes gene_type:complete